MEKGLNTNCTIYTFINKQRVKPDGTARLYTRITIKGAGSKKIPLPLKTESRGQIQRNLHVGLFAKNAGGPTGIRRFLRND